jgi:hypothetical protein
MRTYQRVNASNGVEAVGNAIIWFTAPIWVPLVAVFVLWSAVFSEPGPMSASDCVSYARDLHNAEQKLAAVQYVGERERAKAAVADAAKIVNGKRWQRDCAKVKR